MEEETDDDHATHRCWRWIQSEFKCVPEASDFQKVFTCRVEWEVMQFIQTGIVANGVTEKSVCCPVGHRGRV